MSALEERKAHVIRFCVHCFHEWLEELTCEDIQKLADGNPVSACPNPECGLLT